MAKELEQQVEDLEGRVTVLEQRRRAPAKAGARGLRTEVLCKGILIWFDAHPEGGEATADELWSLGGGAPPKDVLGARKASGDSLGAWGLGLVKIIHTAKADKGKPPAYRIDAKAAEKAKAYLAEREKDNKPKDDGQAAQAAE